MKSPIIFSSIPKPSQSDYIEGHFSRYFVRQSNQRDGEILEVNEKTYSQALNSPFYFGIVLHWKLIGPDADVVNSSGFVLEKSLVKSNLAAINLGERLMPGISQILSSPTQLRR